MSPRTQTKTKAQLLKENKSIKGVNPPDKDELEKNMKTGGIDLDKAGLGEDEVVNQPEDTSDELEEPGDHKEVSEANPPKEVPKSTSTVPDPQEDFRIAMMQYGFKEGQARIIANHAAQIGGPKVFSDPIKLLDIMNSFPYIGSPPVRKNILDFWIQTHGLTFTDEYQNKSAQEPMDEKRRSEKERDQERAYAFDTSSGTIRQAMEGERGLTLSAAEELKSKWKADHPGNNDGGSEPKIIQDGNGQWILNPNAKNLTPGDVAYLEGLRPKPDSFDLMEMGEEKKLRFMTMLGIKVGGANPDVSEKYFNLMQENMKLQMAQSNTVLADAIKNMTTLIEKVGTPKAEDPIVTTMKAQVEEQKKANEDLRKRLDDEREERHKAELARRDEETKKLSDRVAELAGRPPAGAKSELDLIDNGIKDLGNKIDHAGDTLSKVILSKFANPSAPLPPEHKKIIIEGIKQDAARAADPEALARVKAMASKYEGK